MLMLIRSCLLAHHGYAYFLMVMLMYIALFIALCLFMLCLLMVMHIILFMVMRMSMVICLFSYCIIYGLRLAGCVINTFLLQNKQTSNLATDMY